MHPPRLLREVQLCQELEAKYGRNPFDILAEEERQTGFRTIHDDDVFIGAAFAPACSEELIVFPKEHIANILQTSSYDRKQISRSVLGVFPALFFYRGVTDLNIAMHMAPFREMDEARRYYRWHMHIYPRRSRLPVDKAGSEVGFAMEVIDTLPETTATALRRWYEEGPNEALVARLTDGKTNLKLLELFHRFLDCQCKVVA